MIFRPCFQHLAGIERRRIPYTDGWPSGLRLHRLERPEPFDQELQDAVDMAMASDRVWEYPDYAPFYERLSDFIGVSSRNIVVGSGIEGLIRDLVMLCCDPGDRVAFTYPTCAMFDIYARVFGAEAVHIPTDPVKPPTVDEIFKLAPAGVKLLILPSPGQPVDVCYSVDDLRTLAYLCRHHGMVLAVDEAYHGFGAPTALPLIVECDNLVVLRTFSKAFGAASIRVGFAVGHEAVIRPLDAVRQSGEIAGPSLRAATVLMDCWDSHVAPGIAEIVAARNWLRDTLRSYRFTVRGEKANHVLIDMGSATRAAAVRNKLAECGVHVRVNAPPVEKWLMVTCGGRETMEKFYEAFQSASRIAA